MSIFNAMPLGEAARQLPGRPHVNTLYRWIHRGYRGVRLRHVRIGRQVLVRPEDLEAFAEAVAELDHATPSTPTSTRRTRRRRARLGDRQATVEAAADAAGL